MLSLVRQWAAMLKAKMQGTTVEEIDPLALPLLERVRYVYSHLNIVAFADYRQPTGRNVVVRLIHPTIDVTVEDILSHIATLDNSGYILQSRVHYTEIVRPINKFFLTREGYYLPSVQQAVQQLADVMIDLCRAVEEAKHAVHETKSYNLRMLNALLHIMLDLGLTLTDISEDLSRSR